MAVKKKQRWFKYDPYQLTSRWTNLCAISSVRLPRRTNKYGCAIWYRGGLIDKIDIGMTADIVNGDPRFLEKCLLVEKSNSIMPMKMRNMLSKSDWWTWKWKGHIVFLRRRHTAFAIDAKR